MMSFSFIALFSRISWEKFVHLGPVTTVTTRRLIQGSADLSSHRLCRAPFTSDICFQSDRNRRKEIQPSIKDNTETRRVLPTREKDPDLSTQQHRHFSQDTNDDTIQQIKNLSGKELAILCHELLQPAPRSRFLPHQRKLLWEEALQTAQKNIQSIDPTDILTVLYCIVQRIETMRQGLGQPKNTESEDEYDVTTEQHNRLSNHPPNQLEIDSLLSILPGEDSFVRAALKYITPEKQSQLSIMGLSFFLNFISRLHHRNIHCVKSIGFCLRDKLLKRISLHTTKQSRIKENKTVLTPATTSVCIRSLVHLKILHAPLCDAICKLLVQSIQSFSATDLRIALYELNNIGYLYHPSIKDATAILVKRLADEQSCSSGSNLSDSSASLPTTNISLNNLNNSSTHHLNQSSICLIDTVMLATAYNVRSCLDGFILLLRLCLSSS